MVISKQASPLQEETLTGFSLMHKQLKCCCQHMTDRCASPHGTIPVNFCLRAPLSTLSCRLRSCSASVAASPPTLEWTVFTIPLALLPKRRELSVSAASSGEGEQQMMRAVRAEPPRLSCRTLVSCRVAAQILAGVSGGEASSTRCSSCPA